MPIGCRGAPTGLSEEGSIDRLNLALLARYRGNAQRPAYDRARLSPAIVHLGSGAFHRAHQAVYVDDCLQRDPHWAIVGASLRSGDTRDALLPQNCLYTVAVRDGAALRTRIIGSILDVLHAPPDNAPVIAAIAAPETRMVTLTVTEKAYCRNPATGELDLGHPDIKADLETRSGARSVPGVLAAGLAARRRAGLGPISIVSCDNLPDNGGTLAAIVRQFAVEADPALANWIEQEICFPATMVDRIVPATTDDDRREIMESTGYRDAWPVVTEPFSQWVVEDRFAAGRPSLQEAGALLVSDVRPFEEMKLRLLNGSHSALAYLGIQAGHETVSEAVADPSLRAFLDRMMRTEIIPTLHVPGVDLETYAQSLLNRFDNTALKHRLLQIAMDGSQKVPQRLLGTIRDCKAAGRPHRHLDLVVAGWIRHLSGLGAHGRSFEIDDPLAPRFAEIARAALPDAEAFGEAVLDLKSVFGTDLSVDGNFRAAVVKHLRVLFDRGAAAALSAVGS